MKQLNLSSRTGKTFKNSCRLTDNGFSLILTLSPQKSHCHSRKCPFLPKCTGSYWRRLSHWPKITLCTWKESYSSWEPLSTGTCKHFRIISYAKIKTAIQVHHRACNKWGQVLAAPKQVLPLTKGYNRSRLDLQLLLIKTWLYQWTSSNIASSFSNTKWEGNGNLWSPGIRTLH